MSLTTTPTLRTNIRKANYFSSFTQKMDSGSEPKSEDTNELLLLNQSSLPLTTAVQEEYMPHEEDVEEAGAIAIAEKVDAAQEVNIGRSVSRNEEERDAAERSDTRGPRRALPQALEEEESGTAPADKEAEAAQEVIVDGSKSVNEENDENVAGDEVVKMSDTSQEEMKMPQSKGAIEEAEAPAEKESSLGYKLWDESTKEDAADDAIKKSERSRPRCIPPQAMDEDNEENAAADLAGEVAKQEKQRLIRNSVKETGTRRMRSLQKICLAEQDFTEAEDEKKKPRFRWYHAIFLFSIASLIVCLLQLFTAPPFGVWMTSAEIEEIGIAPEGGCEDGLEHCICPRETICATNMYSIVLLTLARCSAFFDYPLYMMMFLSKCHNINNICRRTVLREWIDFADMHKVHKLFGVVVGIETMSHSFLHMLRWGLNGDISLLWETNTGITGLITVIITPLIVWPMVVPALKQNMQFELRKGLHYLAVVWAMALLWHAPSRIYYLIGIPALIYALDYFFGFFIRNTLIENAHFERYGENGVALHFKNPQTWGEKPKTSYVYIMCPWISKNQWHAFTMFPEPSKENHTMLCIGASGDWTKELHNKIKVPSFKSLYVQGPYLSEFSDKAVTTSNAIAVASGIGITPTLSLMLNYAGKKRVNIIWMCREAGLVEYILHKVDIEALTKNSYAFIYYTGKRELALPKNLPVNLFIFTSRPKLEEAITGIVTSIHSGEDLPEELYEAQLDIANVPFKKRMQVALTRVLEIYGADEMFAYAVEQTQKEVFRHAKDESAMDDYDPEAVPLTGNPRRHSMLSFPEDAVSLEGLGAMIAEFCGGIGEYSSADLKEEFSVIDRYGTGFIDREDYDAFLAFLTKKQSHRQSTIELASRMDRILTKSLHTKPAHTMSLDTFQSLHRQKTIRLMKSMINESDNKDAFHDWSIFYCGGSNGIKKNLKEIAKKYGLAFAVEKFDW